MIRAEQRAAPSRDRWRGSGSSGTTGAAAATSSSAATPTGYRGRGRWPASGASARRRMRWRRGRMLAGLASPCGAPLSHAWTSLIAWRGHADRTVAPPEAGAFDLVSVQPCTHHVHDTVLRVQRPR